MGQKCGRVGRKCVRSVRGQEEVGQVSEGVSWNWGRSVRVSARRAARVYGGQPELG